MFIDRNKIHSIYVLIDTGLVIICFFVFYLLRFNDFSLLLTNNFSGLNLPNLKGYLTIFFIWGILLFVNLKNYDLFSTNRTLSFIKEILLTVKSVFYASLFAVAVIFLLEFHFFSRELFFVLCISLSVCLASFRVLKRVIQRELLKRGFLHLNTLIVGAGRVGMTLAAEIARQPFLGMKILGFLDDKLSEKHSFPLLGKLSDFERICKKMFIDEILITIPSERTKISEILAQANSLHVGVRIIPENFEIPFRQIDLSYIGFFPLLTYQESRKLPSEYVIKRMLDIIVSVIAIMFLLPFFVFIALAIKLDTPGTVFFIQKRMGMRSRIFNLYKFRSMVRDADKIKENLISQNESEGGVIFKIKKDPRITKVGIFLRRFSLDELPQLLNVFKGDMSLVGSRPFPVDESEKFDYRHMKRLSIRPGITGMAQIRGRSELSFYRWIKWDLWYIDNWSFGLDLRILFWTVEVVFKGRGAY